MTVAPVSKKDKRRNLITDRFSEIISSFNQNRDQHYRAQLQAVQVDMNLIMRADPYARAPLDDTGDEIAEEINLLTGGSVPTVPSAQGDYAALVGKTYAKFVEDVNNAMEERDMSLTILHVSLHRSLWSILVSIKS